MRAWWDDETTNKGSKGVRKRTGAKECRSGCCAHHELFGRVIILDVWPLVPVCMRGRVDVNVWDSSDSGGCRMWDVGQESCARSRGMTRRSRRVHSLPVGKLQPRRRCFCGACIIRLMRAARRLVRYRLLHVPHARLRHKPRVDWLLLSCTPRHLRRCM